MFGVGVEFEQKTFQISPLGDKAIFLNTSSQAKIMILTPQWIDVECF